jgi:hypothetical protein
VNPVCSGNGSSGGLCGLPDGPNYFQNSATFKLSLPGVTANSTISNVSFSFGTGPETVLAGQPLPTTVPIPAAGWLFGSALLGLVAVARRRSKGSSTPPAIPDFSAA